MENCHTVVTAALLPVGTKTINITCTGNETFDLLGCQKRGLRLGSKNSHLAKIRVNAEVFAVIVLRVMKLSALSLFRAHIVVSAKNAFFSRKAGDDRCDRKIKLAKIIKVLNGFLVNHSHKINTHFLFYCEKEKTGALPPYGKANLFLILKGEFIL